MNYETVQRIRDGVHHVIVPPDTCFHDASPRARHEMSVNVFAERHVGDLDFIVEQTDAAVADDRSGLAQARHVPG